MADYFLNRQKYEDLELERKLEQELNDYEYNPELNQYTFYQGPNILLLRWVMEILHFILIKNRPIQIILKMKKRFESTNIKNILQDIEGQIGEMKIVTKEFKNDQEDQQVFTKQQLDLIQQNISQKQEFVDFDEDFQIEFETFQNTQQQDQQFDNEIILKQDRFKKEQELFTMEQEDYKSKKIEEILHLQKFNERLFQLPSEFPKVQPQKNVPTELLLMPSFGIFIPLSIQPQNLAPNNSKEVCLQKLKKYQQKEKQRKYITIDLEYIEPIPNKLHEQKILEYSEENLKPIKYVPNLLEQKIKSFFENDFTEIIQKLKQQKTNSVFIDYLQHDSPEMQDNFSFLNYSKTVNPHNITIIDQKIENIESLEHIEIFKNLIVLQLSVNKICKIPRNIQQTSFLQEIYLGQNQITSFENLSNLQYLKILNLELNSIEYISYINCPNLQILNLNENQIKKIENIDCLPQLKQLLLFRNKIEIVQNLEKNIFLEILDLSRNKISQFPTKSIEKLFFLRKLIINHNQLKIIEGTFCHIFLQQLFLNGNSLETLSEFYLPALQVLNLSENQIHLTQYTILNLPSLKQLDLSFNVIEHISDITKYFESCQILESIKINDNKFNFDEHYEVTEFFNQFLANFFPFLKTINAQTFSKRDFEQFYMDLHIKNIKKQENIVPSLFYNMNQDYNFVQSLINKKFGVKSPFLQSKEFMEVSNNNLCEYVEKMQSLYIGNSFQIKPSIIYVKELYDKKYAKSLHKIKSFCFFIKYKNKKRINLQKKILTTLESHKQNIVQFRLFLLLHAQKLKKQNKIEFNSAIKIQKVFKGYILRKKKEFLFGRIKYNDPDLEDLGELEDFFNNEIEPDIAIQLPDMSNFFQQYQSVSFNDQQKLLLKQDIQQKKNEILLADINDYRQNRSQTQNIQQKKYEKLTINHNLPQIDEMHNGSKISQIDSKSSSQISFKAYQNTNLDQFDQNNNRNSQKYDELHPSDVSQRIKLPKISDTKQQFYQKSKQFIDEWGFQDKGVELALQMKLMRDYKMKQGQKKKKETAEDRYQKFLKNKK